MSLGHLMGSAQDRVGRCPSCWLEFWRAQLRAMQRRSVEETAGPGPPHNRPAIGLTLHTDLLPKPALFVLGCASAPCNGARATEVESLNRYAHSR